MINHKKIANDISALAEDYEDKVHEIKVIIDANPLCVNLWDENLNNVLCNKKAVTLFKLENEAEYLEKFNQLSPKYQPNGRLSSELAACHVKEALKKGEHIFKWLHCRLDGSEIPAEITLVKVNLAKEGEPEKVLVAGFTRDLTPELLGEDEEDHFENYFLNTISHKTLVRSIANLTDEWYFVIDHRSGYLKFFGRGTERIGLENDVEYKTGCFAERNIVYEEDRHFIEKAYADIAKGIYQQYDVRLNLANGEVSYFALNYQPILGEEGRPIFTVGKWTDINDQKLAELRSRLDLLTGCYNKVTAEELIESALSENQKGKHVMFIIDIDDFKYTNDTYGHYVGDAVLIEVARRIKEEFRAEDVIARIGGDEFIVFANNISSDKAIEKRGKNLVESFREAYEVEGRAISVPCSIGISKYPKDGSTFDKLYIAADKALYKSKELGKNRYAIYIEEYKNLEERQITEVDKIETKEAVMNSSLIATVFSLLYDKNNIRSTLETILEQMGRNLDAERCYILESFDKGETFDNTYEWCMKGIVPKKEKLQSILKKDFQGIIDNANEEGLLVSFPEKPAFLTGNKGFIKEMDNKRFVNYHIKVDSRVVFAIGLEYINKQKKITEVDVNSLIYTGRLIYSYLNK